MPATTPSPDLAARLAPWVVKDGVSLGALVPAELQLALAVVHATLPPAAVLSEREVNEHLKAALSSAACWLGTDHVELRRWLVDTGWLTRDGFGREYHVLTHAQLREDQQPLARGLATMDVRTWVAAERRARAEERAARRARWEQQQRGAAP